MTHAAPATRLIKGGWQLAGGHGAVDRATALADMHAFVDAGIRAFDCADIYTGVEELIGEFLRAVPPGTVRIHTKCVPDLARLASLRPDEIETTVLRSRERLGVDAIDLVQFHWWDWSLGDYVAAAQVLDDLRARAVVREVGLTNFGTSQLRTLIAAGIPLRSHQLQYSLLDRRPAREMAPLCQQHGIGLLCFGALAGGFFHERWLGAPEPVEPLENRSLVKYKLVIDECGGWPAFQDLLGVLGEVATRHGVTIGTVAIRWVLDQPGVEGAIVGARHSRHLPATVAALTLRLDEADREALASCLERMPVPAGDVYELERDRQGRHGRIMRYDLNS